MRGKGHSCSSLPGLSRAARRRETGSEEEPQCYNLRVHRCRPEQRDPAATFLARRTQLVQVKVGFFAVVACLRFSDALLWMDSS